MHKQLIPTDAKTAAAAPYALHDTDNFSAQAGFYATKGNPVGIAVLAAGNVKVTTQDGSDIVLTFAAADIGINKPVVLQIKRAWDTGTTVAAASIVFYFLDRQ